MQDLAVPITTTFMLDTTFHLSLNILQHHWIQVFMWILGMRLALPLSNQILVLDLF